MRSPSFPTARYQRQVITLGSPIRLAHKSQSRARRAFDRYAHLHVVPRELPLEARDDPAAGAGHLDLLPIRLPERSVSFNLRCATLRQSRCALTAVLPRARSGQRSQRLKCRGGFAAGLCAISQHVLSTRVRDVEPVAV